MFYKVIRAIFKPFIWMCFCLHTIDVEYINNIEGGAILMCNHISFSDCILLAVCCKKPVHYMAKAELFSHKFFGKILTLLNAYGINRGSADLKAIKKSIQIIETGEICGIFPEGTRNLVQEEMLPFNNGVAFIAIKLNAPIVPAYIFKKRNGIRKTIVFGEPINILNEIDGVLKSEKVERATQILREKITQLRENNA